MRVLLSAFALVGGLFCAAPVIASTWHIPTTTIGGGGTITGSFNFDAATNSFSNMQVTTTAGSVPGSAYTHFLDASYVSNDAGKLSLTDTDASDLTGAQYLILAFAPDLTALGGTVALFVREGICANSACLNYSAERTYQGSVTTDPISPVPLPAGLPLLALGLATFGVLRRMG